MKHYKIMRRGFSILLSLVMCLGLLPATALAEETETGKAIQIGTLQIKGGQASSVYLGNYQQSSDGINGYNTDPIKWRVLANNEDSSGTLFLLSNQNLDAQQYNSSHTSITWEKSTIRSWLNGYGANENTYETDYSSDNFIDAAFSKEEQGAIAETFVYNATQSDGSSSPNPKYDIPGGNNTTDKIFLLSIEEANNSSYFPNGNDSRKSINTAYVASRHTNMHGAGEADFWRLRSPGFNDKLAALVTDKGGVYYDGGDVDFTYDAVRPAFNLNLNSVLFTSAAEGGKSASGMGSGLASVGDYTGNEWKLTLLDSSRSGFTASTETVADNKVTIAYSNATTGSNEYISAIVQDADSSVPYYGRIAQLDGTTNTASGTVEIDLSGINMTGKTLCVFNEQYNGDKVTDYASNLCTVFAKKSIADCTVDPIPKQTYNHGTPLTPDVTVKDGDVTLTKGTDYTVFYENNVNACNTNGATAIITGVGNYSGELRQNFTIDPRSIEDFTVTLSDTELAYTGDSQSVTVTKVGNLAASLAAGDYEASGTSGTNAGSYTVTVTGKGNYVGTATAPWSITKKALTISGAAAKSRDYAEGNVSVDIDAVNFGNVTLVMGSDYTVAGRMNDDKAGSEKQVYVSVTLLNSNYALNNAEAETTVTIRKIDPAAPTGLTGFKDRAISTVSLPDGWTWDVPDTKLDATGEQTFKASYKDSTGNYNDVSSVDVTVTVNSSGGGYIPTVQKPVIEGDAGAAWTLSSDGTKLTISAKEGFTLADVTLNGVSKGQAAELTGLKTGDKVVIRTVNDADVLAEKLVAVKLVARSKMSAANGKAAVKVYWFAEDGSDINFDGYEIFRSTKRYSGYGKTPFFETGRETYWNTAIKGGNTYYYKVRGYIELNGERYYTEWSKKAIRTVK